MPCSPYSLALLSLCADDSLDHIELFGFFHELHDAQWVPRQVDKIVERAVPLRIQDLNAC